MADVAAMPRTSTPRGRRAWAGELAFGAIAPWLCLAVDRALLFGDVVAQAPAILLTLAVLGPALLLASHLPSRQPTRDLIVAGLLCACALCAWAAIPAVSVFGTLGYAASLPEAGAAIIASVVLGLMTFAAVRRGHAKRVGRDSSLARLAWTAGWLVLATAALVIFLTADGRLIDISAYTALCGIGATLLFALAMCGAVYLDRARALVDAPLRSRMVLAVGLALLVGLGAIEAGDRAYFGWRLGQLASGEPADVADGAGGLDFYPLELTQRRDDACFAIYKGGTDSSIDGQAMRRRRDELYGAESAAVRAAAAKLFGRDPDDACSAALWRGVR